MTTPDLNAPLLLAIIERTSLETLASARTLKVIERNLDYVITFSLGGARYQKRLGDCDGEHLRALITVLRAHEVRSKKRKLGEFEEILASAKVKAGSKRPSSMNSKKCAERRNST